MDRRSALKTVGAAAVMATMHRATLAQDKSKAIKLVVPYAAGGITDSMARLLGQSLQKSLGSNVIIENKPGAAALLGTKYVMTSPPDGDTLLFHNSGMIAVQMLQKVQPYDTEKDFDPVAMICNGPNFLMVHESVPAKTIPELIAYAKTLPRGIECGNSGINSGGYISARMFEKLANISMVHVPYKGSAEVTNAMITGEIKMQISVTTEALNPYIKSGKIKVLGVATKQRTPLAPDIPTIGDSLPGYYVDGWYGILAPAKTPIARREQIAAALQAAANDPVLRERFAALYMEMAFKRPVEFSGSIKVSTTFFKNVIQTLQLTPA